MCLSIVYSGNNKRRAKKDLPDGIKGYKVITRDNRTTIGNIQITMGENTFVSHTIRDFNKTYKGGSHVCLNKEDVKIFCVFPRDKIICVYFNKEDINSIGRQVSFDSGYTVTVKRFEVKSLRGVK